MQWQQLTLVSVERLRCGNGGEYVPGKLSEFCKKNGIIQELTTPYTPELNAVSERMNRTLVEQAQSMLAEANLPKSMWGDAIMTAVYLTNRSPTAAVPGITPFELWYGHKPDLSRLRVFGAPAVVHVPKERRQKLDSTGISAILIGYDINGYRLW